MLERQEVFLCFFFLVLGDLEKKKKRKRTEQCFGARWIFLQLGSEMKRGMADRKEEFDSSSERTMSRDAGKTKGVWWALF